LGFEGASRPKNWESHRPATVDIIAICGPEEYRAGHKKDAKVKHNQAVRRNAPLLRGATEHREPKRKNERAGNQEENKK